MAASLSRIVLSRFILPTQRLTHKGKVLESSNKLGSKEGLSSLDHELLETSLLPFQG